MGTVDDMSISSPEDVEQISRRDLLTTAARLGAGLTLGSSALGAAMLSRFKELNWLAHIRNSRAMRVTSQGQRRFKELFAISHFERSTRR